MTWPKDVPYDPARKRYYLVGEDLRRNPSDYDLLNEADIYVHAGPLPDGSRPPITAGTHELVLPGTSYPSSYGLPRLLATPKAFVARRNKPLDIYGFGDKRLVSARARRLLLEIDADAFEFAECETLTRGSVSVEPYWMMACARIVDGFDEDRSVFETAKGIDGSTGEPYDGPHLGALCDIRMSPDLPAHHHAFLFARYLLRMVFDEVLVDAWRARGFSGAAFEPLQPPTPRERARGSRR